MREEAQPPTAIFHRRLTRSARMREEAQPPTAIFHRRLTRSAVPTEPDDTTTIRLLRVCPDPRGPRPRGARRPGAPRSAPADARRGDLLPHRGRPAAPRG